MASLDTPIDFPTRVDHLYDHVVGIRRDLHRHPEVGLALPRTQDVVAGQLRSLGLDVTTSDTIGSVTAVVRGGLPGPTLLLRADMDALPLTEETGLPFASEVPGAMHACGHDIHTAALIGVAEILADIAPRMHGNVLLMFQPGEEGWFGARHMIEEGVLEPEGTAPPSRAFALHVNPWYPTGQLNLRPGPILSATNSFHLTLHGVAGHGSAPHAAVDPVPAAAELVMAIQAFVARTIDAHDPTVVSVTSLAAGSPEATSAIPASGQVSGTVRTLTSENRRHVVEGLTRLTEGIAAAHGLRPEVDIEDGYPVVHNDPDLARHLLDVLPRRLGADCVREMPDALMGADDSAYVLQRVPGVHAFVGTTPAEKLSEGFPPDNHSTIADYDERCLAGFMLAHLAVVEDQLGWSEYKGQMLRSQR